MALAAACASGAAGAIAVIKAQLEDAPTKGLAAQIEVESRGINAARYGDEAGEGLAAFLERRLPDFAVQPGDGGKR